MTSYKNLEYHAEIKKWDTEQLIQTLEVNGLGDCCDTIRNLEIDGETFLNLKKSQLEIWKGLNKIQKTRLWSVIQLAFERPQDFMILNTSNTKQSIKKTEPPAHEKIKSPIANQLENIFCQQPTTVQQNEPTDEPNHATRSQSFRSQRPPEVTPVQEQPVRNNYNQVVIKPPVSDVREAPGNESHLHSKKPPTRPPITSRPLPKLPSQEMLFPLPPNVVPIHNIKQKSPQIERPLPRPPAIAGPPLVIPDIDFNLPEEEDIDYNEVEEEITDDYKQQSWYSNVDRKQAIQMLQGRPDGTFIVRPSKQANYECSLSVICSGKVYNIAVERASDQFIVGKQSFASVNKIIDYFFTSPLTLTSPNKKELSVTLLRS